LEAALQEARSLTERDQTLASNQISETQLGDLGAAFGRRLAHLYLQDSPTVLLDKIQELSAIVETLAQDSNAPEITQPVFTLFAQRFVASAAPSLTGEEGLQFVSPSVVAPLQEAFSTQIGDFVIAMNGARDLASARTLASHHGQLLWEASTAQVQSGPTTTQDDRSLYWARLRMIAEVRQWRSRFRLTAPERQQIVDLFEHASRGLTTANFPPTSTSNIRVLVSGFDPFSLDESPDDSNPSGAAVLALDNTPVVNGDRQANIEGVVFPVRFQDFDAGAVEQFFQPYLDGTVPVSMIMTISQGRSTYQIEQWAGRRRADPMDDNNQQQGGATDTMPAEPAGLASGNEFLETRLPHHAMTGLPSVELNPERPTTDTGLSAGGSGGGFLSNEIFYRVRLLQETIGGQALTIPMGHLHLPAQLPRNVIIERTRQIIAAALPQLPTV